MKSQSTALRVAAVLFALVCLAHIFRVLARAEVQFAGHTVPMWISFVGAIATAGLAFWMWTAAARSGRS